MKTVAISEFRAHLLNFLNKVELGETLILTSHGKEIARILPPKEAQNQARRRLAKLRKSAFVGDVVSPLSNDWDEQ